jgi:hypothetical protein
MVDNKAYPGWSAEMAAQEHIQTYNGVLTVSKWFIANVVIVLVLMAAFLL